MKSKSIILLVPFILAACAVAPPVSDQCKGEYSEQLFFEELSFSAEPPDQSDLQIVTKILFWVALVSLAILVASGFAFLMNSYLPGNLKVVIAVSAVCFSVTGIGGIITLANLSDPYKPPGSVNVRNLTDAEVRVSWREPTITGKRQPRVDLYEVALCDSLENCDRLQRIDYQHCAVNIPRSLTEKYNGIAVRATYGVDDEVSEWMYRWTP